MKPLKEILKVRKLTHAEAGFKEATGHDMCGNCKAYGGVNKCKKVEPPMDADDWCKVGVSKIDGHKFA